MLDRARTPTGLTAPVPGPAVPRRLCTDCGLSRMELAKACGSACQFLNPDYDRLETQVHGRHRDRRGDELHFGPMRAMYRAALRTPLPGAQWTGLTTRFGRTAFGNGYG